MNEISLAGRQPVDSYGPGGFRIDGAWHGGSLVLSPGGLHGFEAPIDMEALGPLIAQAAEIDVVLIGQGAEIAPLASVSRSCPPHRPAVPTTFCWPRTAGSRRCWSPSEPPAELNPPEQRRFPFQARPFPLYSATRGAGPAKLDST
jgi:hypothetical protein